jgi:hypothetical protein
MALPLFDIDQHEVVQGGSPPYASFCDILGAIDVHAELPHDFSTQFTLRLRSVNEQYSLLLDRTGDGGGQR